ncbi:phage holin family protein [Peptoniphilus sp. MSJ-1]|uniref:Phage holin family protein n=1 Tax=Peptoniphilus ovalis TaxID=2841503 RepID=A0ABS6FJP9_9FIRM|nr:phage holin, LLH family [Peptoniphilus ovalis]MBU5669481.1 phage holin family protein [Peptoniphilus ovalis]
MELNYFEIIQAITVIIGAIAVYIFASLNQKYGKQNVDHVLQYVRIGVKAVEQLGAVNGWNGEEKKQQALDYIVKTLNSKGIKISKKDLNMMIESVVAEFNKNR